MISLPKKKYVATEIIYDKKNYIQEIIQVRISDSAYFK